MLWITLDIFDRKKIYVEILHKRCIINTLRIFKGFLDIDDETLRPSRASCGTNDDEDKDLLFDTDNSTRIMVKYKETVFWNLLK